MIFAHNHVTRELILTQLCVRLLCTAVLFGLGCFEQIIDALHHTVLVSCTVHSGVRAGAAPHVQKAGYTRTQIFPEI